MAQVEVDVESIVVDPDWVTQAGHPSEPLPVARIRLERGQRVVPDAIDIEPAMLERQRFCIEEKCGADVHGHGLALEIEKDRVESAQTFME